MAQGILAAISGIFQGAGTIVSSGANRDARRTEAKEKTKRTKKILTIVVILALIGGGMFFISKN